MENKPEGRVSRVLSVLGTLVIAKFIYDAINWGKRVEGKLDKVLEKQNENKTEEEKD